MTKRNKWPVLKFREPGRVKPPKAVSETIARISLLQSKMSSADADEREAMRAEIEELRSKL